jgi:alpha-1,3-glucosyltransferase
MSERTHIIANGLFSSFVRFPTTLPFVILEQLENAYLLGFAPLLAFTLAFPLFFGGNPQVEFLPLMMTSVYCALGLVWAFIRLGTIYLRQ